MRATVVVLGDIGRSPRMQYHALALAAAGATVDLVGYAGAPPLGEIIAHPRIVCHALRPVSFRSRMSPALFVPAAAADAVVVGGSLLRRLLEVAQPRGLVLVQTPPAVPALGAALVAARRRGARLVVDWHNLGDTVLALRLGRRHPLVRLTRRCERWLGRRADDHLCVSGAMRTELMQRAGLRRVTVLYDRPATRFARLPVAERRAIRRRLHEDLAVPVPADGTALVISPTSWTADENLDLLLEAARRCDGQRGAPVLVLVTGDGPGRPVFEARMAGLTPRRVYLRTGWFSHEQYARVLGAADAGLSLHASSSGLDVPMKVSDMLGSGLPVLALDSGPGLAERVTDGGTAVLVSDAEALASALGRMFDGFPERTPLLDHLRAGVARSDPTTWEEGWLREAWPVLRDP